MRISGENANELYLASQLESNLMESTGFKLLRGKDTPQIKEGGWVHNEIPSQSFACPIQKILSTINPPPPDVLTQLGKSGMTSIDEYEASNIIGAKMIDVQHGKWTAPEAAEFFLWNFPCARYLVNMALDTKRQAQSMKSVFNDESNLTAIEEGLMRQNKFLEDFANQLGEDKAHLMIMGEWTKDIIVLNDAIAWMGFKDCSYEHLQHQNYEGYHYDASDPNLRGKCELSSSRPSLIHPDRSHVSWQKQNNVQHKSSSPPYVGKSPPLSIIIGACSGSSAMFIFIKEVLMAHGINVTTGDPDLLTANKNPYTLSALEELIASGEVPASPEWSRDVPDLEYPFYEKLVIRAMNKHISAFKEQEQTLLFKTMPFKANKNILSALSQMGTTFGYSYRLNSLDRMICGVRNCFNPDMGYPVLGNGTRTKACFDRHHKKKIKTKAHFPNTTKLVEELHVMDWMNKERAKQYQALDLVDPKNIVATDDLFAYEYTMDEDTFSQSRSAWISFLSFAIECDKNILTKLMRKHQGTRILHPQTELIENFDKVASALKNANPPLGQYLRVAPKHQQQQPEALQESYLIAELVGGLTNQAIEVWEAVKAAQALNRTLVLPRVRSRIPQGEVSPSLKTPSGYFDLLWDVPHFLECIKDFCHGVRIDVDPDALQDVDADAPSGSIAFRYHSWEGWGGSDIPQLGQVSELLNNTSKYVKLVGPYKNDGDLPSQCFVPSTNIKQRIEQYLANMPSEYSCLHARVESDWYTACCHSMYKSKADVSSLNPEEWTCEGHSQMSCYKSPSQIASYLIKYLPQGSALWISSGADPESLQPLRDVFNVFTASKEGVYYMDYGDALVDEALCKGASNFWGMGGSTYTAEIQKAIAHWGGHASTYAKLKWSLPKA